MAKDKSTIAARVVLYARVSTEEQGSDDHHSLEAQLNEMRDYARQKGWTVVGEFVETLSGTRRDRPQLDALLELARSRNFDILLVHELSRLSRSVYHTLDIFDLLGKHNIGFASVRDPDFDFADPTKRFFLIILAAIHEYYIGLLKMHISKAKRQRARAGLYNASIVPYGYASSGDPQQPPVIVPKEAEAVRFAYEKYAAGHHSHVEIMELLTESGYRNRQGKRFPKDTVADMLGNPFYMGKVLYRGDHGKAEEIFDGLHEPIVTEALWESVQRVRASRRSASRAVQKPYRVYLLSNLARCDVCGRKLRSQASKSGPQYYREMSYERGYVDCPHHSLGVRTEVVDKQIHAIVNAIQLPDDWQQDLAEQLGDDEETLQLQRQRQSLEAERRRVKEMYLHGDFEDDADLYHAELARIRRELDSLPTLDQLENLGAASELVRSLHDVWPESDPADQRDLLRLMVREVQVDVATGRVVSVQPQAVFIPLFRQVPLLSEREFGVFVPTWTPAVATEVLAIDHLPAVLQTPEQGAALPFVVADPLLPEPSARIAPALSHALTLCREAGGVPQTLVQIVSPERPAWPADLRKWVPAVARTATLDEVLTASRDSLDVVSTRYLLWDRVFNASQSADPAGWPKALAAVLTTGGVWYSIEALPMEMAAHWAYTFFPELWEWARARTRDLHTVFGDAQAVGLNPHVKRQVFYQPVKLSVAAELAERRVGPLARLTDQAYEQGRQQLQTALQDQGADAVIGSEFTLIEMWAQKGKG